jgi:hypothetical protein
MKTFQSLADARHAIATEHQGCYPIEIEHRDLGTVYIVSKAPMHLLAKGLQRNPMAEIVRLVAEHPARATRVMTEAEEARARVTNLFARAESLEDSPAAYLAADRQAREALAAWRDRYPEAAAAEDAAAAEEKARKAAEYRHSFIARGID